MADIKLKYGTDGVAITITLASLGSSATAGQESTAVDNSSDLFMDALVQVKFKLAAGAPANDKAVYVYAYGTSDQSGPVYPEAVTGSNAAITLNDPTGLRIIGIINTPTNGATYISEPMSVAAAFGGILPKKWGVVIRNYSGQAFTAVGGDHKAIYQGVLGQTS